MVVSVLTQIHEGCIAVMDETNYAPKILHVSDEVFELIKIECGKHLPAVDYPCEVTGYPGTWINGLRVLYSPSLCGGDTQFFDSAGRYLNDYEVKTYELED